jgi:putative aldouronate transport system permease protein
MSFEERKRKRSILYYLRRDYQLWLLLLPAVIEVFIFHYIPMYGIQLAFREFDYSKGIFGGEWVGLKYFKQFIESYSFWNLMRNTFIISITSIVVGFPIPIILALLINQIRNQLIKKSLQTTVYMPHFISTPVMVGLLIVLLSPNSGIVGKMIKLLGLGDINLMGDPAAFVPVYVLSDVWQHAGWNSIIYLAALSSVDVELYDACKVDGGTKWHMVRYIEIPALVPTMVVLLILSMGGVLSVGFEKVFLMQNGLNISVSEVISTYTYKIGLLSAQFSYATAIGLFNTVINFTLLTIANQIARRTTGMSLW